MTTTDTTTPHAAPRVGVSAPIARIGAMILAGLALVTLGVFPQLSARFGGDEYQLRVAPLDPIEPFRGAYVALTYPDLNLQPSADTLSADGVNRGTFYIPLKANGEVWIGGTATLDRPDHGPYITCSNREVVPSCGIESWFLPQDKASELEAAVRDGTAIAVVRIDGRGNAVLIDVRTEG